jgi:hypothetical protein
MIALLLLVSCQKGDTSSPTDTGTPVVPTPTTDTDPPTTETGTGTSTETGTDTGDPLPTGLTGTVPPVALAAPAFSGVRNRDGAVRSQADLMGHPTVLWFYPAAFTGG